MYGVVCQMSVRRKAKGRRGHVVGFSEAPHRTTIVSGLANSSPQRPLRLNHPTPTDNNSSRPAAHLRRSRCVPTTILSAVRRSTLERCVVPFFRRRITIDIENPHLAHEPLNTSPPRTFRSQLLENIFSRRYSNRNWTIMRRIMLTSMGIIG